MKKLIPFFFLLLCKTFCIAQLKDVKIIIPKEIGYSYYDFVQFFPGEKYFALCANSLSIYNTETAEVVDEYDLGYMARNLSINAAGDKMIVTLNDELWLFSFRDQKLALEKKIKTVELIKGLPNSEYYGSLPISAVFFTGKSNELYIAIGSFTLLYDMDKAVATTSHVFPVTDYVMSTSLYKKGNEVLIAKSSGTVNAIYKQSLTDLSDVKEVITNTGTITKTRIRDSLLVCFTATNYFIMDLEKEKIVHEVRMMKYDYNFYDKKTFKEINKRPAISVPDTINFASNEFVYDIDFLTGTKLAVYSTTKGLKFIDLTTKKLVRKHKTIATNIRVSPNGQRIVSNGYYPYKALRVHDPATMQPISERVTLGNSINSADMSPGKRWMFTNAGNSGYFWDMRNFSKYAELKDISGSDTSFIYGLIFLNDSEAVVNSGKSFDKLNLSIYNINRKKYTKFLKKNVYAFMSGFLNGEFYYSDYKTLHIFNVKTLKEETYEGMFSLAAGNPEKGINFTKELVFIPDASKYKVLNRKTKKVEYESESWTVTSRVLISPDNKFVFTSGQVTKKQNINGTELDMPVSAIVKIDMAKKAIVADYAITYYPYDFKIKENGTVMGVWYLKQDYTGNPEKETVYSEYELESGKELFSKTIAKTPETIAFGQASETGKYFVLYTPFGNFFKIYDGKGNELLDLSDMHISIPKCFFMESLDRLIITSGSSSLATFIDLKNKRITGQLANATSDNFFLVTSEMHYLGSKEFVKNMRFKYQSEMFSFEQFDAYLNQPHKVLRAFGCSDTLLIKAYETAYLKRMKVLGLKPDGKVNFSALPSVQDVQMNVVKGGKVDFSVSANKGQGKLTTAFVYNNGTLIFSEPIPAAQGARFEKNFSFETSSGINRFEFSVKDDQGLESPRIVRLFNNTDNVKPDLYLVVVASEKFKDKDFDLAYAVKDAGDLAQTMSNSKSFGKIKIKKLYNQSFSPDSVKQLKQFFSTAGVNDVVMVFFAGHGYLDTDLSYYFPTYYTDFTDPKINSVSYNSFETLFKEMKPIRKLMFIDACFSGEVDEDVNMENKENNGEKKETRSISGTSFTQNTTMELSKAIFSDLRQNSGVTVISSAGGTEEALEGEKWNNGLFTHCLMDGMMNYTADLNGDKIITLSELQKFVSEEVNRLSEGKQTPTYRVENSQLDYELW
jgi:hypothetical protein